MIDAIPPVTSVTPKLDLPPESERPTSGLASDFETFLKMLTAQARYQDPLNPVDSTEYASQLAQFSMVEQQVLTNDTLTALISQFGARDAASLSAWIGMEARAAAPAQYDGAPITVVPTLATGADQAILVVRDSDGVEVQRQPIALSSETITWSGLQEDGTPFAPGVYRFEVESYGNKQLIQTDTASTYSRVREAQIDGSQVMLILASGVAVNAADVTAVREPG